jgi:tol-pal system protein YbgF
MRASKLSLTALGGMALLCTALAGVPALAQRTPDAVRTEDRFNALERQNAALTGQVEQLQYKIQQLQQQMERMQADYEFRINQLEGKGGGQRPAAAGTPQRPGVTPATPGVGGSPPPATGGTAGMSAPPSAPGPQAAAAPPGPALNAEDLYDQAFNEFQDKNYDAAERSFRSFLQSYPRHAFAGNAQFWIGEIYFMRKDYARAAAAYADGYRNYPKSSKGPDNLFQLGRALALSNKVQEACTIWDKFGKDYPNAGEIIRTRVAQERQKYKCT